MSEIFGFAFFRYALAAMVLVAIAAGIIGSYIVVRRLVFAAGGITHASFAGLGFACFMGWNPVATAAVSAVLAAIGIESLGSGRRVRDDSAIGVIWAVGMALGTLFIFLTPGYVPELTVFLFGDVLTVTATDLIIFAAYLAVTIAVVAVGYRIILAAAFDPAFATTRRLPAALLNACMTVLAAIGIVLTIRLVGIVLLMSMFTLPTMTAELFSHRLSTIMVIASAVALVAGIAGLLIASLVSVPVSALIVLLLALLYAAARLARS